MNPKAPPAPSSKPLFKRPLLLAFALVAFLVLAALWLRGPKSNNIDTSFHEVRRGDFTISVVEGGSLAAVSEVSIRNEVEGVARIISIVPEGSYVNKGDLLVELDSGQAQDQVNQQLINFDKAKFAVEQARAQLEIQKSATNSDYLAAKLKVEFAKIDRRKYLEGQRLVDLVQASNDVVEVEANLVMALDNFRNSTNLAAKGYETKLRAEQDRLSVMRSHNSLVGVSNKVWILQQFDIPKNEARYDSDVLLAEQELDRVVNQNKRRMAQYEADLASQINTLALSEKKLERDQKNLAGTKIYAPQDGLVVYGGGGGENRFSSESLIEGGATVRNRQELIKLPDLSRMKVNIKIHESHINMIHPGLPAYVILDPMPDVRYAAVVEKVAPLPDTQARWGNPNLKVYNTEIHITERLPNIKPGVSAKAEIIITNIANTLSVPIQAITSHKGKQVAYVLAGGKADPRPVETGMYNTKFIEITKGLKEGERVLLSPPFDVQEKDLDGAILAEDEKSQVARTNVPPQTSAPSQDRQAAARRETGQDNGESPVAATPPFASPPADASNPGMANRQGPARGGGFNREEMLKQYDKDGDGELDETEREAMRAAMAARFGGQRPGGARMSQEEMLKRFDTNGDGELDETERNAMRDSFRATMGGGRAGSTNAGEMRRARPAEDAGEGANDNAPRRARRERSESGDAPANTPPPNR